MQNNSDPFVIQTRQNKSQLTIGSALLVVAVLFGALGSGLLGFGRSNGGPITRTSNRPPSAILPASPNLPGPITSAGVQPGDITKDAKTKKQMPEDVLAWLRHLERCEKQKEELCQKELTQAGVLKKFAEIGGIRPGDFDDPEAALDRKPGTQEKVAVEGFEEKWESLINFYHSLTPPAECIPTANKFNQHVSEVRNYMGQIRKIFDAIGNDMGDQDKMKSYLDECRKMIDTNKASIDVAGNEADKQVQAICDKYEVNKWFSIKEDVGGGIGDLIGSFMGH